MTEKEIAKAKLKKFKELLPMFHTLNGLYDKDKITLQELKNLKRSLFKVEIDYEWLERDKKDMDWDFYDKMLPEVFKAAEEYDKKHGTTP